MMRWHAGPECQSDGRRCRVTNDFQVVCGFNSFLVNCHVLSPLHMSGSRQFLRRGHLQINTALVLMTPRASNFPRSHFDYELVLESEHVCREGELHASAIAARLVTAMVAKPCLTTKTLQRLPPFLVWAWHPGNACGSPCSQRAGMADRPCCSNQSRRQVPAIVRGMRLFEVRGGQGIGGQAGG